ncbi:PhaM family polyhydroxyalkanoate granule multifunctional regulatory protein [Orrella sp. 11846]|uniref:PhaM family polyhydroxyalkanoate granule multifunctional regulatory protein n=1 Tax=Orrella sp. 11846 TaxID=3409913 RepID=UPI003B5C1BF4
MSTDSTNPFGFPGFQQSVGGGQANPLATSLDMMRNTMQSFGTAAMMAGDSMSQNANADELERRISDLKTVQNWLQLNMSMVTSSIQAMEVQLATIRTLRSFLAMGSSAQKSGSDDAPSPLEVVLGLKPALETQSEKTAEAAQPEQASVGDEAATPEMPMPDMSAAAAQAWWEMLQNQFVQMANATAQAAQMATTLEDEKPAKPSKPAAAKKAAKKSAKKSAATGAKKAAKKAAARKTTPKS